jgi:hypothetical protein
MHVSSHFAQVSKRQCTSQVGVCLLRGSDARENESIRIQASSCNWRDRWNCPRAGARGSDHNGRATRPHMWGATPCIKNWHRPKVIKSGQAMFGYFFADKLGRWIGGGGPGAAGECLGPAFPQNIYLRIWNPLAFRKAVTVPSRFVVENGRLRRSAQCRRRNIETT